MAEGIIFSDESGIDSTNQYGCICTVFSTRQNMVELHDELKGITTSEVSFKKIKGTSTLETAKAFLNIALKYITTKKIRVYTIVWDKQDKRHDVRGRCDNENLIRMYYKVLKEVTKDYSNIDEWAFYPDEYTAIDWQKDIVRFVENTKLKEHPNMFKEDNNFNFPNFYRTIEKDSKLMYNIQLADLFAGIVRYSREYSNEYLALKNENQISLFDKEINISSNLRPKLKLLQHFKNECSKFQLGINFSKANYFQTFNKKNNIWIWHYKPQSEHDKAPTKSSFKSRRTL